MYVSISSLKGLLIYGWNTLEDDLVYSSSLNVFKMVFINYGRKTVCRWVSDSLLTCDTRRLSRSHSPLHGKAST